MRENFVWLNRFTLSLLKQHPDKKQGTIMKWRSCGPNEIVLLEVLYGNTDLVAADPRFRRNIANSYFVSGQRFESR